MKTTGISEAKRKDGSVYYKAYFTFKGRHISLGSFDSAKDAAAAYSLAVKIIRDKKHFHLNAASEIEGYPKNAKSLSFEKWVMLINLRDSGIYSHNPIYLQRRFFDYYLDPDAMLRFDIEELFYYTNHKIQRRGGHFFVADYGMQVNILTRYGIKNYAVCDRDYRFVNGEKWDFRAGNIEIINSYHGVTERLVKGEIRFIAKIHINGDFIVGKYKTVEEAATAYNKAADYLEKKGLKKRFPRNFIETADEVEYARLYHAVRISSRLASALSKTADRPSSRQ
jgi:hypothetical protein